MSDDINIFASLQACIELTNISLQEIKPRMIGKPCQVLQGSGCKIIQHPHETHPLILQQLLDQIGANKTGTAGNEMRIDLMEERPILIFYGEIIF